MKDEINIMTRKIVRLIFHIFYILPIKRNRILFESYKGKSYSCNPKYISEHLRDNYKEQYELIWVFKSPEAYKDIRGIVRCKYNSLQHFLYRFTSKVILCNMTDEVYLPKRKKQIVINTWHAGGAYKKVGLSYEATYSKAIQWQDDIVKKETSFYISSSELFTKYNIREAYGFEGEVLRIGLPRNDLFFDGDKVHFIKKKIERMFGIEEKQIILYAPTFRGDFAQAQSIKVQLPFDTVVRAAENRYGKPAVILNRSHYADFNKYDVVNSKVIDVTSYPDMQELLAAADLLITDYSSSIWDYALLARPCILYVPDLDEYIGERGTYTSIETWPGIIAENEKELELKIGNISDDEMKEKAAEHFAIFGTYETGNACRMLAQKIREVTG